MPLTTDPDAGIRLDHTADGRALMRFRSLMTECFDIPKEHWGRSFGEGRLNDAWKCLLDGLVRRQLASDRTEAYALPLTTVNSLLKDEAAANKRDPHYQPFEDPPPPLPVAAPPDAVPKPPTVPKPYLMNPARYERDKRWYERLKNGESASVICREHKPSLNEGTIRYGADKYAKACNLDPIRKRQRDSS